MRYWKWVVLAAAWSTAVGSGLWALFDYEMTPGIVAASPDRWPAGSVLRPDPRYPTVVMFVHPHCPCTRASLHELLVLATHCGGQMKPIVVFLKPRGFEHNWEKTDLWETAGSIPGATCFSDVDGTETARFQALVSGETLMYDAAGNLLFHGGITGSRGHQGDNAGRSAIESFLAGEPVALRHTPVFGCSLRERNGSLPLGPRPASP
ncbi:MAG TPA: hypothetical protein VMR25_02100 [Planctomycetaceae bacterium]|jgi:hypothetical protein|nr:hypothetical protein [Planctomycetaceae bacterium]